MTQEPLMPRTLTLLFRRDPSADRLCGGAPVEGYRVLWPDGRPVALGLDAFCRHGQRLLGLGRHLEGRQERLVDLLCFPLAARDDDLTRLPGHRVRRFLLQRHGPSGRLHFLDGTPTETVFEAGRDDARVLEWVGLTGLPPGGRQWFDLAARPLDVVVGGSPSAARCAAAGE
jgi:hypothetical protein